MSSDYGLLLNRSKAALSQGVMNIKAAASNTVRTNNIIPGRDDAALHSIAGLMSEALERLNPGLRIIWSRHCISREYNPDDDRGCFIAVYVEPDSGMTRA